jgi:hypothetical protein
MDMKELTKIISEDYKRITDEERVKYTKIQDETNERRF